MKEIIIFLKNYGRRLRALDREASIFFLDGRDPFAALADRVIFDEKRI